MTLRKTPIVNIKSSKLKLVEGEKTSFTCDVRNAGKNNKITWHNHHGHIKESDVLNMNPNNTEFLTFSLCFHTEQANI